MSMKKTKIVEIDIQCSCCGNHRKLSNAKLEDTVNFVNSGWGSCGDALYCPECAKTWKERNGDRQMSNDRNTFIQIMRQFFDAINRKDES